MRVEISGHTVAYERLETVSLLALSRTARERVVILSINSYQSRYYTDLQLALYRVECRLFMGEQSDYTVGE